MAVIINGTAGADQLFGNASDEVIHGLGGNDTIYGYDGEDQLFGDDGDDEITLGGNGMRAGIFAPVFTGTVFGDGGAGNDTLIVFTNASSVTALGGAGNDTINVRGIGGVTVDAGSGDDVVNVQTVGTLAITLGAGYDVVRFDNTALAAGYTITIADYTQNQDRISLDSSNLLSGFSGGNPFTSGYLRLVQSGADTLLQFDRDGAAGTASTFETLIRLQNVQASTIADIDLYPVTGGGRIVRGTDGNDTLTGSNVFGGSGNDTITGTFGVDVLHGDDGNDTITGVSGSDKMYGDAGNDLLTIGLIAYSYTDEVLLDGGTGDDYLFFGNSPVRGEDIAAGYPRSTRAILNGGDGNDILVLWGSGGSVADAGAGNDYVALGGTGYYSNVVPAVQRVTLGAGADTVSIDGLYGLTPHIITDFSPGEDRIVLEETALFRDRIVPGLPAYLRRTSDAFGEGYLRLVASGNDTILQLDQDGGGNEWSDLLLLQNIAPGAITEIGGFKVSGGTVNYTITQPSAFPLSGIGMPTPATLRGGGGNDTITGTAGNDALNGESGNDTLYGLAGNDTLWSGFGDNLIYGGDGNDTINGQGDHDRLYGEAGDDVISFSPVIPYGAFTDTVLLDGGDGNDRLSVSANNAASTFLGGAGNDTITVDGFARSTVDAGTGDDSVTMSNPFTRVTLGAGRDVLTLRAFQTTPLSQSATVTDFLPGTDKLVFSTIEYIPGWSGSGNPFALGFLWLLQDGADVVLRRDPDGGGNTYYELVRFENVTLSRFSAADFSGFDITAAPLVAPLQGTAGDDRLLGSPLDNTILGGAGNDVISGLAGNDTITGGAGNDTIDGGTGVDVAIYAAARGATSVTYNVLSRSLSIGNAVDGTDTVRHVEQFQFADGLYSFNFASPGGLAIANFNAANGWSSQDGFPRHVADVNGDGYGDIVGFGIGGVLVATGSAGGRYGATTLSVADFGANQGWTSDNTYHRELADVNGDGRADIVGFGISGMYVSLATTTGFGTATLSVQNFNPGNGWSSQDGFLRTLADVNGDGKADVIGFGIAGTYVALGQGNGMFQAPKLAVANFGANQGWTSDNVYHRALTDVNGDGRADIVGFGAAGVYVALGQTDGSFGSAALALANFNPANGWTTQDAYTRTLADLNGDGRADIVGFGQNGVFVANSLGDGQFTAASFDLANFGQAQGWTSDNVFHREVFDVNHDGMPDIVGFGIGGVLIALNQNDVVL